MLRSWITLQRETDLASVHDTQQEAYPALLSGSCLVIVIGALEALLEIYVDFHTYPRQTPGLYLH